MLTCMRMRMRMCMYTGINVLSVTYDPAARTVYAAFEDGTGNALTAIVTIRAVIHETVGLVIPLFSPDTLC